jgi:hypothetical protein
VAKPDVKLPPLRASPVSAKAVMPAVSEAFDRSSPWGRFIPGAAYPPASEGIAATAKSLGLEVATEIAEKIDI